MLIRNQKKEICMINSYNKKKSNSGVTLVEMLITGVVFSIIFGVAIGTFTSVVRIQKYNLSQQQLLDQSSYAIEYIARALRMAKKDETNLCGNGAVSYAVKDGGTRIEFLNYKDQCQEFFLDTSWGYYMIRVERPDFSFNPELNSYKYIVNDLTFVVSGDNPGDNLQPRVTIFIDIQDRELPDGPRLKLQTTVSQRNIDR